jgi:hypothetical protein
VLGAVLIAQAAGVDIFGFFARWNDETFRFETNRSTYNADLSGNYASLQDALQIINSIYGG